MPAFFINAGDLRTRITFQAPTIIEDAGKAQSIAYANAETNPIVWARWINAHGQEAVQSETLKSTQRATVIVRYRDDIKTTWRIVRYGEIWQILSVDQVQDRNRWVEMVVERAKGTIS